MTLFVHCARPGMVIGKDGAEVEKLRLAVEALIGKKVKLNIVEVRNPDMNVSSSLRTSPSSSKSVSLTAAR